MRAVIQSVEAILSAPSTETLTSQNGKKAISDSVTRYALQIQEFDSRGKFGRNFCLVDQQPVRGQHRTDTKNQKYQD
tara:strand:+ start:434 stop:664 length:231 start_codon:yes stop_codon:yes gene_type:complete